MAVYLVQHGKSLSKDKDPQKGLSEEGVAEVRRIADVAGSYRIGVRAIVHSGKKRARQTAELFAAVLKPEGGLSERTGLAPLDDVAPIADSLDPGAGTMLVGHLPFMSRLVSLLVTGDIRKTVLQFQNGGIVCLDKAQDSGHWRIRWTLMPHID